VIALHKSDVLNIYSSLSDVKSTVYRNTLAVATLLDILLAKGIITRTEFRLTAQELDREAEDLCESLVIDEHILP